MPFSRREDRETDRKSKKRLCETGMDNRQCLLQQYHSQAAKNPLEDNRCERG
jgi:hypothetical protein